MNKIEDHIRWLEIYVGNIENILTIIEIELVQIRCQKDSAKEQIQCIKEKLKKK